MSEQKKGRLEMERVLDRKGRWRNKVVAFRVSPEEDELLETKVRLSGLTKQDYIISRLLEKEITVVGCRWISIQRHLSLCRCSKGRKIILYGTACLSCGYGASFMGISGS